jgi:hypothetical protein
VSSYLALKHVMTEFLKEPILTRNDVEVLLSLRSVSRLIRVRTHYLIDTYDVTDINRCLFSFA